MQGIPLYKGVKIQGLSPYNGVIILGPLQGDTMNWLYRSTKTAQQNIPLSMESLKGMRDTPQAQTAASILRMFDNLFKSIPQVFTDEPIITDVDTSNLDNETFQAVKNNDNIQFGSWEEAWDFLANNDLVKSSDLEHSIKLSLDLNGLGFAEGDINGPHINGMSPSNGTWPQDGGSFIQQVSERLEPLAAGLEATKQDVAELANTMVRNGAWNRKDVRSFYDHYLTSKEHLGLSLRGDQNPNWMSNFNQLMDNLSKFSASYLRLTSKDEAGASVPDLPPLYPANIDSADSFISENKLIKQVKNNNVHKATQYFLANRPELADELLADARRLHRENELNEYQLQKREFDHAFGYADGETSWLEVIKQPFSPEEDPRISLEAKKLSEMGHRMNSMNKVQGAKETGSLIATYVISIQMTAFGDEQLTAMLGNQLEYAPDRSEAIQGITLCDGYDIPVPEVLAREPNPALAIENHYNEMKEFFEDLKRVIKQRVVQYGPEEEAKMRELGIARKVPEINYSVLERGYPGGGGNFGNGAFTKFIITFAPTPDLITEKGIPQRLLEEFHMQHLHGSYPRVQDMPAIGWVGGFIDPAERSMYVFEVQSDLMQNTNQMRDPRKVEEERKVRRQELEGEIQTLNQQIEEIKTEASKPKPRKDPRAGLQQKIRRIQNDIDTTSQEIEQLNAQNSEIEAQPGFDPNSPDLPGQYRHNKELIDNKLKKLQQFNTQKAKMEENLARIPAPPPENEAEPEQPGQIDQQSQQKIDKLQNRIEKANEEIRQSREPIPHYERPQWHDYRNTIENTFGDWVKIFWNTAVREAIKNNMNYLYIITADELFNKVWRSYGGQKKMILFQRVYDSYGKDFYGGQKVNKHGKEFWQVDLKNPELKVASSWLTKALGNMPKFGSLLPVTQPMFVFSESGIAFVDAFPPVTSPTTTATAV